MSTFFKKFILNLFVFSIISVLCFVLFACSNTSTNNNIPGLPSSNTDSDNKTQGLSNKKIAVVYFSAFDDIGVAAKELANYLNADLIQIEPTVPYEESDFNSKNSNSRPLLESRYNVFEEETEELVDDYPLSYGVTEPETKESKELQKATELPKIKNINTNKYNVIFLGYPVWYNDAPKVIYTFLKDIKNKTIIPFSTLTNGESLSASEEIISNYVDDSVNVMGGIEFTGIATESEINAWLTLIDINI